MIKKTTKQPKPEKLWQLKNPEERVFFLFLFLFHIRPEGLSQVLLFSLSQCICHRCKSKCMTTLLFVTGDMF